MKIENLVGEIFLFQCARYIYHGKVKSVNADFIELEDAGIVFETGEYSAKEAEDRQELPHGVVIARDSLESFYKLNW